MLSRAHFCITVKAIDRTYFSQTQLAIQENKQHWRCFGYEQTDAALHLNPVYFF